MAVFVANLLPVCHRSGVNLIGSVNSDCMPKLESKEEFTGPPESYAKYQDFWKIQFHFVNKTLKPWENFKDDAQKVIDILAAHKPLVASQDTMRLTGPYLVFGKLFNLQLNDSELHRQVILQMLIHLKRFVDPVKEPERLTMRTRLFELISVTLPKNPLLVQAVKNEVGSQKIPSFTLSRTEYNSSKKTNLSTA